MTTNLLPGPAVQLPNSLPDRNDTVLPANGRKARRAAILGNRPMAPQETRQPGPGNAHVRPGQIKGGANESRL
jgi:hypothetical protein